jgi:hypothetical protein
LIPTYDTVQNIVSGVGAELGLSLRLQNVLGSTDADSRQISSFLVETMEELLTRYPFRRTLGANPVVVGEDDIPKRLPTADTDKILIDSRLLKLGAKWRYLKAKGFTYEEEFRAYENRIAAFAYARTIGKTVNLNVSAAAQS